MNMPPIFCCVTFHDDNSNLKIKILENLCISNIVFGKLSDPEMLQAPSEYSWECFVIYITFIAVILAVPITDISSNWVKLAFVVNLQRLLSLHIDIWTLFIHVFIRNCLKPPIISIQPEIISFIWKINIYTYMYVYVYSWIKRYVPHWCSLPDTTLLFLC